MVEHILGKDEVTGSIPVASSSTRRPHLVFRSRGAPRGRSVDPHTARALVTGLTRFPAVVVEEAGILAALPFADPAAETLKQRLLDQALRLGHLDSVALAPILAEAGSARLLEGALGGFGKGFSFNRPDTEPAQAQADLRAVIELLGARHEIAQGLASVSERLMDDPEAVAEQHRLLLANQETTKRLADYSASD